MGLATGAYRKKNPPVRRAGPVGWVLGVGVIRGEGGAGVGAPRLYLISLPISTQFWGGFGGERGVKMPLSHVTQRNQQQ